MKAARTEEHSARQCTARINAESDHSRPNYSTPESSNCREIGGGAAEGSVQATHHGGGVDGAHARLEEEGCHAEELLAGYVQVQVIKYSYSRCRCVRACMHMG
jgi:hypothetical protein